MWPLEFFCGCALIIMGILQSLLNIPDAISGCHLGSEGNAVLCLVVSVELWTWAIYGNLVEWDVTYQPWIYISLSVINVFWFNN